ncbi:MAG: dihydroneopterin aldolase [Bacteroides sp.]|nr:dihydroneopterin aldolase [Bacteroides sp.]
MSHTFTVSLRRCRFFARHGVFGQERRAGNEFEVSAEVVYSPIGPIGEDTLSSTVSYADLYEIVSHRMERPSALLETVAFDIGSEIRRRFPLVSALSVTIIKTTPPIAGFTGEAEVTYAWRL